MPLLGRRCSRLLRLLTVLWAVSVSRASESQPSGDSGFDTEQLLSLIVHAVTAEIRPLVDKLASRMDGLDSRLNSNVDKLDYRLNGIETRINALDLKQDRVDASLQELVPAVESAVRKLDSKVDESASRMNSTLSMLDSRMDKLAAESNSSENSLKSSLKELVSDMHRRGESVDSRLDKLVSTVNSTVSLGSRLDELASAVNSTASGISFRLDDLANQVDNQTAGQSDRLDNVSSHLESVTSRLDELEDRIDNQTTGQSGLLDSLSSSLNNVTARLDELTNLTAPRDCSYLPAGYVSGIHVIHPGYSRSPVAAYCDMETDGGGWTVFQRRKDIEPRQSFELGWSQYKAGFGELDKEFWWGLENLWRMTKLSGRQHQLRVDLAGWEGGRRYAVYQRFSVASEREGYRLSVDDYTGNAGDGLTYYNGKKFSTKDRDQDRASSLHCAQQYRGGWWHKYCYIAHLNGPYLRGQQNKRGGIIWNEWRLDRYSLKESRMMIRPV